MSTVDEKDGSVKKLSQDELIVAVYEAAMRWWKLYIDPDEPMSACHIAQHYLTDACAAARRVEEEREQP